MATRKAVKQAEELRISQIGDFKNRLGGIQELPSGLIVRLRNPGGLRAFMATGTIPNSLMAIIQDGIKKGKGDANAIANKVMPNGELDQKLMEEMGEMLDTIATTCIVEPKIHPRLTEEDVKKHNAKALTDPELEPVEDIEDLRRADRLYADELPDDDKQFLFQWVSGGTRDLEQFREKQRLGMDSLSTVTNTGAGTQSSAGVDAG